MSNCIVHRSLFVFFLGFFFDFCCCSIKLSLCQPTNFLFSQFFSPSHQEEEGEVSEWLHGPSCQLGLNATPSCDRLLGPLEGCLSPCRKGSSWHLGDGLLSVPASGNTTHHPASSVPQAWPQQHLHTLLCLDSAASDTDHRSLSLSPTIILFTDTKQA